MELKPLRQSSVPADYKQTEVGPIPEAWEVKRIGDIATVEGGYAFSSKNFLHSGKYQVVKMSNLYGGSLDLERSASYLNELDDEEKHYLLRRDEILITLTGTTGKRDYGFSQKINDEQNLLLNQRVGRLIVGNTASASYVAFQIRAPCFLDQFFDESKGGTGNQTNVGTRDVAAMRIPLPPLPEQRAIAEALSDVDALIGALDQLIAKKRDLKQAAMHELLTGQIRLPGFHGEWEVKTFDNLFTFGGGYSASRDQLSSEGHCYLHYGDIHKSSKTFIDARSEYQDIPKLDIPLARVSPVSLLDDGDVVFVDASEDDEGTSRHVVIVNKDKTPFISGLHTIVAKSKTNELDHRYKRFCFQSAAIKRQFYFYAVGTKVSGISKANITKLTLPVPSLPEQTAIAEVLSDMDAELAALEQRRDKTRALKQGMMQELLTGRTRLPVAL